MNLRNKLTLVNANPNESTPLSRAIFFIIIGVAFYLLDRFSLFMIDDYDYAFKFGTHERISSLKDIFVSQCDHYMLRNGRFLVHCIVQLFCGILGVEWFRIFNTVMFVLFCGMTTRLVSGTYRTSIMWYAVTAFVIWLFIPQIGLTVLGNIACGVNYLWVGVATLAFIILWQKISQDDKRFSILGNIGLGIVGAIIGSLQESFSIPVAGTLFIYYCFNFKNFRGSIIWLVCGYWIGSVALILAPGNFIRLQKEASTENIIVVSIRRFIAILGYFRLLIIVAIFHIVIWSKNRVKVQQIISYNCRYYLMLLIGFAFTVVVAYTGQHQLFFMGWLVILIMLKLIYEYYCDINVKIQYAITGLILLCMVPMLGFIHKHKKTHRISQEMLIQDIKFSRDGNVVGPDWDPLRPTKLKDRYVYNCYFATKKSAVSLYYTGDTNHFKNYIPCSLNELESLTANRMPVSPNIWHLKDYYCYVIKVPKSIPFDQVKIEAKYPIEGISKIKRKLTKEPLTISYILNKEQISDVVTYGDYQYAILWQRYNGEILDLKIVE